MNIWSKLKGKNVKFILNFCLLCLIFPKKLPPLPPIFQLMWGVLPTLPLSETAPEYLNIIAQDLIFLVLVRSRKSHVITIRET